MKYRKTYGINGLLEWHGIIESNGLKMKVDFTNGSTSALGVAPAAFTTEKELTQHIIENSEQFKGGRIRLVRTIPIPGTENEGKAKAAPAKDTPAEEPSQSAGTEDHDTADEGDESPAKVQVKVSSVEDAKDYLVDHYGLKPSNLRTRATCIAAGEENGIEFIWE